MANGFGEWFHQHVFGLRLDDVRHACPDCPIGAPRTFCPTCVGSGSITEAELARWVARKNAEARR